MTREEAIRAIERQVGRALTADERAFVEASIDDRPGEVTMADVMVISRDVKAGAAGTPAPDVTPTEGSDPEDFLPTIFDTEVPNEPVESILDLPDALGRTPVTPETEQPAVVDAELERQYRAAAADAGLTPQQVEADLAYFRSVASDPAMAPQAKLLLSQRIEALKEQIPLGPAPIGVSRDFVAQRQLDRPLSALTGGVDRDFVADVEPRYFDGDEFSPAGLDPAEIARIQTRLVNAGLMEPDEFWAGTWDTLTSGAYKAALGMANQSGRTVDQMITQLIETLPESVKEQRERVEASKTFQAAPFIRPSQDAIAQTVKSEIRAALGRDPTSEDLAWGIAGLGADYRRQYEAEVAAARADFNANVGEGPAGTTIQAVDPLASFRERLEERFGPEIDRLESLDDVRNNMTNVFASIRTMNAMVGG